MDRTATLLRAHGHVPRRRLDVLYYPRMDNVVTGDGRAALTDNAAYFSVGPSFLIVPSFLLESSTASSTEPSGREPSRAKYGFRVGRIGADVPDSPHLVMAPAQHPVGRQVE